MKKITLLITLAGCLGMQAFGQTATPAVNGRSVVSTAKTVNTASTFMSSTPGVIAPSASVQKFGSNPSAAVAFVDDFSQPNDTNGLKARGYIPYFRGTGLQGIEATWFQGIVANWPDYNNGSNEYVSASYEVATDSNDIDNWLVLPALDVAAGDFLSFYSRSVLASTFPDSIRVMYSAVGDSTPEATSWVQLGNFKVNTTGNWLQDQFMAPTAGTTARFAIRYAVVKGGPLGSNSFLIGIDQLEVYTPPSFDMQAVASFRMYPEYTRIPFGQVTTPLSAVVRNNGGNATTGGNALFEVVDASSTVVFSETVTLPNLTPGATAAISTTGSFSASAAGELSTKITLNYPGDLNTANDVQTSTAISVTDSVFARDNDTFTNSLGIGAGVADGIIGQSFTVNNASDVTSVSFFLTDAFVPNPAGSPVYATIHTQPAGTNPDAAILATTTTMTVTPGSIAAGGEWYTLPLNGPSLAITPGQYFVGVHEADSAVTMATTDEIVTPGTVWVSWNTIPTPPAVNGWANPEDFLFNVTYLLRMNFGTPTGINEVDGNSNLIGVYPSPATSELNINIDNSITNAKITIFNSMGMLVNTIDNVNSSLKLDVSGFAHGIYTIKVTSNNKEYTKRFTVIK